MSRCLLVLVLVIPLAAFASDIKYTRKTKDASGEHGAVTFYHQGLRVRIDHRNEFGYGWKDGRPETIAYGNRMATIYQCDLHRVLQLDFDHHQYTVTELDRSGEPMNAVADPPPPRQSGAKVKVITETRDTGETRQIFGQTARRFVTTRKLVPSPGACSTAQESTEDGWYLEIERPRESCSESGKPAGRPIGVVLLPSTNCVDDFEVEHNGPKPPGMPVEVSITMQGNGNGQHSMTEQVSELSRLPLDPQIFDLPMGYKHVDKLDDSPNLPWLLRGKLMWQSVKSTVWGWTPWGK